MVNVLREAETTSLLKSVPSYSAKGLPSSDLEFVITQGNRIFLFRFGPSHNIKETCVFHFKKNILLS